MRPTRLDYDRIAGRYDERERDHAADPRLAEYLDAGRRGSLTVLDVGCGTGKQLASNHQRWPQARLVGVDRSRAMLRIVITNIDPWSMGGWLVYRYFPDAWALDERDFRPAAKLVALLESVGFAGVQTQREDLSQAVNLEDFLQYVSERHRASQLMAIADAAYAAGLGRLERDIEAARPATARATSEFVRLTISGRKPVGAEPP